MKTNTTEFLNETLIEVINNASIIREINGYARNIIKILPNDTDPEIIVAVQTYIRAIVKSSAELGRITQSLSI